MLLREAISTERVADELNPLRGGYLAGLDTARGLAVLAIIWVHTPRSAALQPTIAACRFAVPFFVATTVLLTIRALWERPELSLSGYARKRTRRLLLPFVAWTVIYLAFKLCKRAAIPDAPSDLPGWEVFLLGSAYHLWFLPFLWVVSLTTFAITKGALARGWQPALAAGAGFLAIGLCLAPLHPAVPPWDGLWYMWLALPAACASFPLTILLLEYPSIIAGRSTVWFAAATFALAMCLMNEAERSAFPETLAGLSWLLLALAPTRFASIRLMRRIAPLALGIYLVHLLFLKVGETIADRCVPSEGPAMDVLVYLFAVLASVHVAWFLSCCPQTRWLIGAGGPTRSKRRFEPSVRSATDGKSSPP